MIIREVTSQDKDAITALYKKSQAATGLPNPRDFPPETLCDKLYARKAHKRFIAIDGDKIVGHGMVEVPNPDHIDEWRSAVSNPSSKMYELGGAFVDPERAGEGIWTKLLMHRIEFVRSLGGIPVTATWSSNSHVKRTFYKLGAVDIGVKEVTGGSISLYVL